MASNQENSISEHRKINYFVAGQLADTVITYLALTQLEGFKEVGPAGSEMVYTDAQRLLIAKIAVTAFIAGFYALSREYPKAEFVGRKAIEISTLAVYLVLASNVLQVAPEVLRQLSTH